jgi:hypothetical protein
VSLQVKGIFKRYKSGMVAPAAVLPAPLSDAAGDGKIISIKDLITGRDL